MEALAAIDLPNVPLLVIGVGLLLFALFLPALLADASGGSTLRWLAAAGGVAVCVLAFRFWIPKETPPPQPLTHSECVDRVSKRMAELAPPQRPVVQAPGAPTSSAAFGLVSGSGTGTYYVLAQNVVDLALRESLPMFNRETQGTLDNVSKMADRQENAALGFAQSDFLSWMERSSDPAQRQTAASLRMVLPLYAEEVHVLARRPVGRLAELAGKRIVFAQSSQGSKFTAENLLRSKGVEASPVAAASAADGMCQVVTGAADAMVIVAGKPTVQVRSLDALLPHPSQPLAAVHLMSLADVLPLDGYEAARVGQEDYAWVQAPVDTLAVRALLMAFDFSPRRNAYQKLRCEQLGRLGEVLRRHQEEFRKPEYHPKWREVDFQRQVSGWSLDRCANPAAGS